MANTNCLDGWACPKCGHDHDFYVTVSTVVRMYDDGWDDHFDTECDDTACCVCGNPDCGYAGTVADFTGGGAL